MKILSILSVFFWVTISKGQEWTDFKWDTTKSGLRFHLQEVSPPQTYIKGDTVSIHFIWYDGLTKKQLFSTKDSLIGPQKVALNNNFYVKGFQESLLLLKNSKSGYFIIPPELAYGKEGLQGQHTLYYYIEIVVE